MTDDRQLREDLSYVRSVLARTTGASSPATLYFLWAVIVFFGFAMLDFAPDETGFYWMIAGPVGGVLSGFLGWRAARALGQVSSRLGRDHGLHWVGLMIAILLVFPLVATGAIRVGESPRIILLIVAFAYWTAGVYLDGRLLWVAVVVAAGYLLTIFQREIPYLWTLTGAVLAASFVVCGIITAARVRRA